MEGKIRLLVYLFCIKEGEQNFVFLFLTFRSFLVSKINALPVLPITHNHHKISLPNYDERHERRSACLISI